MVFAARRAHVDEARDLRELWNLILKLPVERAQLLQEAPLEDIARADPDHQVPSWPNWWR